jgi:hypothetical protein
MLALIWPPRINLTSTLGLKWTPKWLNRSTILVQQHLYPQTSILKLCKLLSGRIVLSNLLRRWMKWFQEQVSSVTTPNTKWFSNLHWDKPKRFKLCIPTQSSLTQMTIPSQWTRIPIESTLNKSLMVSTWSLTPPSTLCLTKTLLNWFPDSSKFLNLVFLVNLPWIYRSPDHIKVWCHMCSLFPDKSTSSNNKTFKLDPPLETAFRTFWRNKTWVSTYLPAALAWWCHHVINPEESVCTRESISYRTTCPHLSQPSNKYPWTLPQTQIPTPNRWSASQFSLKLRQLHLKWRHKTSTTDPLNLWKWECNRLLLTKTCLNTWTRWPTLRHRTTQACTQTPSSTPIPLLSINTWIPRLPVLKHQQLARLSNKWVHLRIKHTVLSTKCKSPWSNPNLSQHTGKRDTDSISTITSPDTVFQVWPQAILAKCSRRFNKVFNIKLCQERCLSL